MINIAIPSYQRPNNVLTLNNIPLSYKDNTYLFVRPEEYELYKHYETQAKIVQLKNCTNIGDTRQYIAEYFDGKKMWMLDDDIKIFNSFYNQEKDIIRTDKNTIDEIQFYECISYIEQILEHHYHGNLRFRIFPRGKSYWPYKINTYGYTNTFLNLEKINIKDINYNHMTLCEDMYVFLSLIKKGYSGVCVSRYMVDTGPPNSKGGCSTYRTIESHNAALDKINMLFPQYTIIKKKAYSLNLPGNEPLKAIIVRIKLKPSSNNLDEFF